MTTLINVLFVLSTLQLATSDWCVSQDYPSGTSCDWGCCYSYIYPCCEAPFYTTAGFIAPVVIVSIVVVCIIVAVIWILVVVNRRRRAIVQYTSPMIVQPGAVVPAGVVQYDVYGNPQTNVPPAYTSEPPRYW